MKLLEENKIRTENSVIAWDDICKKLPEKLEYRYIIIYGMSGRIVSATEKVDVKNFAWDEVSELRCFDEAGEIHGVLSEDGMKLYELTEAAGLTKADYLEQSYTLGGKVLGFGLKEGEAIPDNGLGNVDELIVRRYLEYDEDGQAQVVRSRCYGFSIRNITGGNR